MIKVTCLLTSCLLTISLFAQQADTLSTAQLSAVVVTAFKDEPAALSPLTITSLQVDSLTRYGNYNLTDLLAKTPGITMLTTGVAIAKPVIRGLYGNRILVLLSGLKFDNQQWQEEHGLGLSDLGLDRVEMIKGPMSVLYGTEAIGGLINLIEEQKPTFIGSETEGSLKFNTNTLGGLIQAGIKKNLGNKWFGLRLGVENNADYSDGNSDRILNSRFDGYYLKGAYGFQKKNWTSENHFMSSFNRFGFIFKDVYAFIDADARWSRALNVNPTHLVLLNIFSSENKWFLKNETKLSLNAGVQSNVRMENEGGGAISLNMHLLTFQYLAKWEKELTAGHRLILSNLGSFETNTNYGARKIVPDANMQESNVSAYYEIETGDHFVFENGVSVGEKWVKTFFTPDINGGPNKELTPFSKFEPYWNAFSGVSFFPGSHFNFKLNFATGVRIPNLAELSSDGLHEGVFTYEIGNPDLKNEQNLAFNALLELSTSKGSSVTITPFYNFFSNYVFLTPTGEDWFGFPIFRYRQQNARQYGLEAFLTTHLIDPVVLSVSYSGMISKTEDGNYTPYLPAQKIKENVSVNVGEKTAHPLTFYAEIESSFEQDKVFSGEIATPAYALLNAGFSMHLEGQSREYEIGVTGHNLLNEAYIDHLSRFKYFGLKNIGRNVTFYIRKRIDHV